MHNKVNCAKYYGTEGVAIIIGACVWNCNKQPTKPRLGWSYDFQLHKSGVEVTLGGGNCVTNATPNTL